MNTFCVTRRGTCLLASPAAHDGVRPRHGDERAAPLLRAQLLVVFPATHHNLYIGRVRGLKHNTTGLRGRDSPSTPPTQCFTDVVANKEEMPP